MQLLRTSHLVMELSKMLILKRGDNKMYAWPSRSYIVRLLSFEPSRCKIQITFNEETYEIRTRSMVGQKVTIKVVIFVKCKHDTYCKIKMFSAFYINA